MFRLILFQFLEQFIHRILKFFVILAGFAGVDELQQRGKVLFFLRGFICVVVTSESESKIPFAAFYLSDAPILIGIRRAVLEYSFSKNFEK